MRVMIVEDQAALADVLGDFVRELGHEAVVVHDAETGVTTLERQAVDTILLDVDLPGMSGLDFLRLPAVRDRGVPVVVISGVATEAQAAKRCPSARSTFSPSPSRSSGSRPSSTSWRRGRRGD